MAGWDIAPCLAYTRPCLVPFPEFPKEKKKGVCLGVGRVTDILRLSGSQASPCVFRQTNFYTLAQKNFDCCSINYL